MPQIQNHFFCFISNDHPKNGENDDDIEMTCDKTGVEQPRIPSQEDIKTGEKLIRFCHFATLQ